jgi:endonuclease/exonuclease/phosphatase family metal-dependent hydrolase
MRFATFNIRHGLPPGRTDVDHRLLASTVVALDADVLGLQEVDRHTPRVGRADQAALLARSTGTAAHFGRAIDLSGGEYGNALLVRGDLLEATDLELPSQGESRQAILARVRVRGPVWTVAVTHLQNQRWPDEAPAQLDVVLRALDRRAGTVSPAVLLGDLNLGPDRVVPLLGRYGFTPVTGPPTFPSRRPRERIDWIAVRGAAVGEVEVPDVRASDHRPLVARLSLPTAAP